MHYEEKAGCFAIIVLQMYCYYQCSVALPHGTVDWSAVCDCVFPDHTQLLFNPAMKPCPEVIKLFFHVSCLQIRVGTGALFFLFLNRNICCGYSKEPSQ